MDLGAGLAAAGQAMTILKGLRELDKSFDQVALKGQIVDLMDQVLEIRIALQDAREALRQKDDAIAQLKDANQQKLSTVLYRGYRYPEMRDDPGKPSGRPFCLRCEQAENKLIGTTVNAKGRGVACPQCNSVYSDATRFFHTPEERDGAR